MLKRVFQFALIASLISLSAASSSAAPQAESNGEVIEHTIEQGQFLNRIAAQYNTTIAKILELNPGLNPDKIQVGQKIKVPSNASAKTEKPAAEKKATESKSSEIIEHTVVSGDMLSKIAAKYNTTVAKIQELNPGINANNLKLGSIIKIKPNCGSKPAPKPATEECTTKEKESKPTAEKAPEKAPEKVAEKVAEKAPQNEPKKEAEATVVEKPSVAAPSTTTSNAVAKSEYIEHIVAVGETFSHIVVKYRTTTVRILKHNPGLEPAKVRPGMKIRIPVVAYKKPATESQSEPKRDAKAEETSNGTYHTIVSGDSFGKLAAKYNTTAAKIQELNPNLDPTKLKIGQKVRVK